MAESLRAVRAVALERRLIDAARPSGGWGYYAGKSSRIEATCWVLAALAAGWSGSGDTWTAFAQPHVKFLAARQRADGLLVDTAESPTNLAADGLAAWMLRVTALPDGGPRLGALQAAISRLKGAAISAKDPRQDNSLQAWPWLPDTFSWVEPTAWCLLALKKDLTVAQGAVATARIVEAERMLDNRCCDAGGWNYGNASALGQDLRAHVPPTALALLALQNRRDLPSVVRSIRFLNDARLREASGAALGLVAICLHVYGFDVTNVLDRLADVSERTEAMGNLQSMAIALCGLTVERHKAESFRVAS